MNGDLGMWFANARSVSIVRGLVGVACIVTTLASVSTGYSQWQITSCIVSSSPGHEMVCTFNCAAYTRYKVEVIEKNSSPTPDEWRWGVGQSGHPTSNGVTVAEKKTNISLWTNPAYLAAQCQAQLFSGTNGAPPVTWTQQDTHDFNW